MNDGNVDVESVIQHEPDRTHPPELSGSRQGHQYYLTDIIIVESILSDSTIIFLILSDSTIIMQDHQYYLTLQ